MPRKPSYVLHDGFRMPMGFPPRAFASGLRYAAQPGDVFVSSYPKCGTTWTQYIVYLLLREGRALPPGGRLNDAFPHLEEVGAAAVQRLPKPRLIKTHLPFALTPRHERAKYVYVARNPFDCAVSFYHHTRGFVRHYNFADGTFDEFFECFIAGEVDFGDYFDNLLSWFRRRDDANLLFTTYERMIRDPRSAVVSFAEFLGGAASRAALDNEIIDAIVGLSSLSSMRADQDRWATRRPPGMPDFIRKGVVGDWVNYFSPDQARRLADKFERVTADTGAERLWPDVLTAARKPLRGHEALEDDDEFA